MAERTPSNDQAAFGVFPQLKRNRSKQDREAAKNVPVDLARGAVAGVLGAPGDIESLVRMLPYLDEKTVLPTSEDIEKRLPFRSETPVSKAASGLGTLAGGFYTGPGSPLRVVGALPKAIKHGAEEFAKASVAGVPHVIKPKGGNWYGNLIDQTLEKLKPYGSPSAEDKAWVAKHKAEWEAKPESDAKTRALRAINDEMSVNARNEAMNNWVDRNLTNYIKKEMATPEDPVRRLAEQGITHFPVAEDPRYWARRGNEAREAFGSEQMAKSDLAKQWENRSDTMISSDKAQEHQDMMHLAPGMYAQSDEYIKKLSPETPLYRVNRTFNPADLGFDHVLDVLRQDVAAGRIRPDQLNKVSMEQAVRRTAEYDQEMAKKMRETALKQQEGFPVHKEYPEGYKWIELAKPEVATELPSNYQLERYDSEVLGKGMHRVVNPETGMKYEAFKNPERAIKHFNKLQAEERLADALKYEGNTMGHCVGGYCPDVLSGDTRIFSLRDVKGEPHVTIEVQPRSVPKAISNLPDAERQALAQSVKDQHFGGVNPGSREEDRYFSLIDQAYLDKYGEPAPNIVQIKGKQNAAPKADYLPYVQDFVRGGDWADVGDIKNTGLRQSSDVFNPTEFEALKGRGREVGKYLTPAEIEELQATFKLPPEGMKRGGKVSISKNPDTMMLEVNNRKMADGGLAKLIRALPKSKAEIEAIAQRIAPQMLGEFVRGEKGTQSVAGKTQKQFAKEKEMVHDIRPTGVERPLPKPVDIEKLKGNVVIGIPGDPTISDKTLHSLAGVPLDSPSPQHGGPLYGLGRDDAFWASGLGAANRVQNLAREAGMQYDAPVLGKYIMMGPESINYAQHFADANLSAINPAKMSKGQIESFNNLVREGYPYKKNGESFQRVFPAFPGIESPSEAYLHFSIDPELRKHFNALMQMPTVTEKHGLPSGIDVRHAITEPDLRDLETGVTGKSIGRMRPEVTKLGLSEHPTYSHDIPGEFMGSSKYPIPYELSFPDTVRAIRENPKQAPHEFGSLKMVGPRQIIDQQMIDEIKQYEEQIKKLTGKKEGGAVDKPAGGAKQPAAYINGDEFVNAAKKYGIKDSMNNLNKIVDLVNKGLSVDDAARQVADGGMEKAAGGAIRGDDLILEERPL